MSTKDYNNVNCQQSPKSLNLFKRMNKSRNNLKVKKTLVRNCEQKIKPNTRDQVIYDVGISKAPETVFSNIEKENTLNSPALCSSELFANYLSDIRQSEAPPLPAGDLHNKGQNCVKMTKKLNFHFNDKIYRNLIELNANITLKSNKKDKRQGSVISVKRDVEPNIEDFYEDVKDEDIPPSIPVRKPKFKAVRKVENGRLHKLVASFENL